MKVRVLSPAIDEITEAALWFESKRVGLGGEFWRLTDEVLRQIERHPSQFAKSDYATDVLEIRFAVISRFQYVIHFLVESEEVQIISVAHGGRRPGYWLRRIRN